MPNGCSDDELPWNREAENRLDTKYPYGKRERQNERGGRGRKGRACCVHAKYLYYSLSPSIPITFLTV